MFYSKGCVEGFESTCGDWNEAEVLLGSSSVAPAAIGGGATTRQAIRPEWPPKCWIRVVSYEFYWSIDRMENEVFTRNVRLVAFDEVKGFEDNESRTSHILCEWRSNYMKRKDDSPKLFVLPIVGTLFSPSCTNACNFLRCLQHNHRHMQPTPLPATCLLPIATRLLSDCVLR
jgi:hypothetical protein